jgi:hypothetical protein
MPDVSGMKIAYVLQTTQGDLQIVYKDMTTGKLETLASGAYSMYPKVDGDLSSGPAGSPTMKCPVPCAPTCSYAAPAACPGLRIRTSTASYNHPAVSAEGCVGAAPGS